MNYCSVPPSVLGWKFLYMAYEIMGYKSAFDLGNGGLDGLEGRKRWNGYQRMLTDG
jgi:hypothetical protein